MLQHWALSNIRATSRQLPVDVRNDSQGLLRAPVMVPMEQSGD